MLHYRHPDVLQLGRYDEQFSHHKGFTTHSIPQAERWPIRRSQSAAAAVGPGQYRTDIFCYGGPENEARTVNCAVRSGCVPTPKYSFPTTDRAGLDGSLKGISPFEGKWCNPLSPGQYPVKAMGDRIFKACEPRYSIPTSKETAEALRERKRRGAVPGPGHYGVRSEWDELGKEKSKEILRLTKKKGAKNCWAGDQYTHIFSCLKPAPKSKGQAAKTLSSISSSKAVDTAVAADF